jgi:hypothetical protein
MAPQMIESIAIAQLTEHRASAERLRLRKQARAESRRARLAAPAASRSVRSRLPLRAHPA